MINDDYRQSNDVAKASLDSHSHLEKPVFSIDYSEYQRIQEENFQLKQRVDPYSEDCYSIEDSLQKEYSSDRGITE
jgi:endo-alpha-1,4-polygalactosaminidase (GH114 family)